MKDLKIWFVALFIVVLVPSSAFSQVYKDSGITFTPIRHATFVIQTSQITIFVDPVGSVEAFHAFPTPDVILITDIHGDHLKPDIVKGLKKSNTTIFGPKAVIEKLPNGQILNNGDQTRYKNISIETIPAYNLTPERSKFHAQGRGNGYVLTINQKRIYISGDTEDIPEMRALKAIDYAFVCMNLPYTMTVDQAASAVLDFQPKVVIPYHYRGKGGMSDLQKFQSAVAKNDNIDVKLLKWY
jgi:L-ascorbate metabolism protein UlaG (beta-lactamase superfamily)